MSDPKHVGGDVNELLARARRIEALMNTPEGRARAALALAEQEARETAERAEIADRRNVPRAGDLRAVALAEEPSETPVLIGIRRALAWRRERSRREGAAVRLVLYVSSPVGRGKTAAASHCVVQHRAPALYVTAPDVALLVRNGHSDPEAQWRRWVSVDLLVIDEVGTDAKGIESVVSLVLDRCTAGGATVLLGNLSPTDFLARYARGTELGERLNDRVRFQKAEGCGWFVVDQGPSLRDPAVRAQLGRPPRRARQQRPAQPAAPMAPAVTPLRVLPPPPPRGPAQVPTEEYARQLAALLADPNADPDPDRVRELQLELKRRAQKAGA